MTSPRLTTSTIAVVQTLRDILLSWENADGAKAADTLQGATDAQPRFYIGKTPNNLTFPYATLRLSTRNDGKYHGMRLTGALEVLLYGRPWTQLDIVNAVADLFDQAMLVTVESSHGLLFCFGSQRDQLPPGGDPVDSETVTIRLVYTLAIWPAFLTSLTRTLPPE